MSEQHDGAGPFYRQGNYLPVEQEVTAFDLPVTGTLPDALTGLYVRNGPNPRHRDPGHWFLGDGMLHGVRLDAGRASWYRNRWVRTRYYEDPDARYASRMGRLDRTVGRANTHVVGHAGRIFALVESSFPTEVDGELETIGPFDFGGRLRTAFTAHPKICPRTGELHFFGYGYRRPFLTYHRLDAAGSLVRSEAVPVAGSTLMHDFAITERHVVFMDLPVVFRLSQALRGSRAPYAWSDEYGARLGLMPRDGSGADVRWFEIEPCYVFHTLNAYEEDDVVTLDVVRYPELWRDGWDTFTSAALHRFRIDLAAGAVTQRPLDDRPVELPQVDPRRVGLRHAHGYALGTGRLATQLVKYTPASGAEVVHDFGPGRLPAEAVFVPAGPEAAEDEGWLLTYLYEQESGTSALVVLDARDLAGGPVARVALPRRVPFGFHGSWIPDGAGPP